MTSDSEVNNYCDTGPSLRSILVEIDIYNNNLPTLTTHKWIRLENERFYQV